MLDLRYFINFNNLLAFNDAAFITNNKIFLNYKYLINTLRYQNSQQSKKDQFQTDNLLDNRNINKGSTGKRISCFLQLYLHTIIENM